jgi:hypothetical protein
MATKSGGDSSVPASSRFLSARDVAAELRGELSMAGRIIAQAGPQPIGRLVKVERKNLEAWLQAKREARRRQCPWGLDERKDRQGVP